MTTSTDKKVSRVTSKTYTGKFLGWKPRKIVVTILPGDTLVLRLQRTKQVEHISIQEVFAVARSRRIFAEAAANPKLRKARRKK